MSELTRRQALTTMTTGVTALGAASVLASNAAADDHADHHIALGWNAAKGEYELPSLPYAYDALEPVIDEQTMRIHHTKHHAGYVRGLNGALAKLAEIREGTLDAGMTQHWTNKLSFHAGGHINHALFWTGLAPIGKGGEPGGPLADQLTRDFGSVAAAMDQLAQAATTVEGSGWGWLVWEPLARRLMVLQMFSQQHAVFASAVPIFGIDVWEHAYYLRYQNRRRDYVNGVLGIVNWKELNARFDAATG